MKLKTFKNFLTEEVYPLTKVDEGIIPRIVPGKGGYRHQLFHSKVSNEANPNQNANLWLSLLSNPENNEHEFHFAIHDTLTPDAYRTAKERLRQDFGQQVEPAHIMASAGMGGLPDDRVFGPTTMFDIFSHIKNVSNGIPSGQRIVFDMSHPTVSNEWGKRKANLYRKYLQRFVRMGIGQELPSDHPNKIVVTKF